MLESIGDRERESDDALARGRPDAAHNLRIRAAWLYYVEGRTQHDVATNLGVNRVTVTRLLSEARRRGEVMIRIESRLGPLMELQRRLETRYGLDEAVVAPFDQPNGDPLRVIAAAAGAYISGVMANNMTVGVGWGRTLHAALPHIAGRPLEAVRIISLLGGIAQARRFNPAEFAWQFAELFASEGYLVPAPALVDSARTRHALLEHCGIDQIFGMAETSDVAFFSCAGISSLTTSYRVGHVAEADRQSLIEAGAVGDILYNFIDQAGRLVDHPVNGRAVSLSIERLSRIRRRVLISGGPDKRFAMSACLRAVRPNTLITDEQTAVSLLA